MIAGYKGRLIYIPQCIKTQLQPTLRERTQESESTPSKLVDDLVVTASPRYVGDSRCNLVYSLISPSLLPSQLCVLAHRRLAFRDIYGQSINSVRYTFPFHGRVYRHVQQQLKVNGPMRVKTKADLDCPLTQARSNCQTMNGRMYITGGEAISENYELQISLCAENDKVYRNLTLYLVNLKHVTTFILESLNCPPAINLLSIRVLQLVINLNGFL